jgi:hypothetical protein
LFYFDYYSDDDDDNHYHHSKRISLKSRHHHDEDYSSKRTGNGHSSYYNDRFDRQTYPPLLNDQPILESGPPTNDSYYNTSQSSRDRGLTSHYIDSERNRYPSSYR